VKRLRTLVFRVAMEVDDRDFDTLKERLLQDLADGRLAFSQALISGWAPKAD
jgi:hypothetical protein